MDAVCSYSQGILYSHIYDISAHFLAHTSLYLSFYSQTPGDHHFYFNSTMKTPGTTTGLSAMADNTVCVLAAYIFAFFPWAVMHNIDFISEKWPTVRKTRTLACVHIISSVVLCVYVAVYVEAQRQCGDSKELGAAIAALMFNLIQLLRTVTGKV